MTGLPYLQNSNDTGESFGCGQLVSMLMTCTSIRSAVKDRTALSAKQQWLCFVRLKHSALGHMVQLTALQQKSRASVCDVNSNMILSAGLLQGTCCTHVGIADCNTPKLSHN